MNYTEMPEGWKRLNGDKGPGLNDGSLASDIDQALDMLKAMAEALERTSDSKQYVSHVLPILAKFEEWK